uniref:Uncharacterized protein n=1 Tax=Ascaris lumbricoides TaxID=6252 RepID=A0A0M3HJI6_ASCLU
MTSLPNDPKIMNITRHRSESLQSYDSEKLGVSPPHRERRFSLSQMLGRRTSVEDHLVRDSKSMINGGWHSFALALLITYHVVSDKNAVSKFLKNLLF